MLKAGAKNGDAPEMRVPNHHQLPLRLLADGSPPGGRRDEAPRARTLYQGAGLPGGREGVVKARLSILLAALGELPAPADAPRQGQGLSRLLDAMCPSGSVVLHGKSVPGFALPLEHIVVAPRGLVVVSPYWVERDRLASPAGQPAQVVRLRANARSRSRSFAVRETLRRASALRGWLAATAWEGTTVWAAVCSAPALGPPTAPPVTIGDLWVGHIERLPSWLGSGPALVQAERERLARFLGLELATS